MTQQEYNGIANATIRNDWEDTPILQYEKFTISQFESTAFDSDYQCYKVRWKEWERIGPVTLGISVQRSMVFKITNATESIVLQLLSSKRMAVPTILARMRCSQNKYMLFEQFLPGVELYGTMKDDMWCLTAEALSQVHLEFWELPNRERELAEKLPVNDTIREKIYRATLHTSHNSLWQCYMREVLKRLEDMPKTLIHGDMFPTNVLINNNDVGFIDWADSCVFAYAFDIARLTSIIDVRTLQPMCPCPEKVILTYYEAIKDKLGMAYTEFKKDIQMAQFIEIASNYSPPGHYAEKEYNSILEKELNRIAIAFYSK